MECPYCHGELEPGTLSLCYRDPTYWLPKGSELVIRTKGRIEKAGGLYLDPRSRSPLEAWYCRACQRMIVMDIK